MILNSDYHFPFTCLKNALVKEAHNEADIFFEKPSKPYHVGIHWIALTEYSARVTVIFSFFLHNLDLVKLATSSIRVKSIFLASFTLCITKGL